MGVAERSIFADLVFARSWGIELEDVPLEHAKRAYVRDDIDLAEFERRVAEYLRMPPWA